MALADIFPRTRQTGPVDTIAPAFGSRPNLESDGLRELAAWVDEIAALTRPDRVHWVDASVWNASDPIALNMILDDIETLFIEPGEQ